MGTSVQRDVLLKIARDRLYPSLTNPNFLVLRSRRRIFQRWINLLGKENLRVLDVGGRYQPYRQLFGPRVRQYVSCDILRTDLVDVVGDGEALPFADRAFDTVVATQVFEYFQRPHKAAEQIRAVLKPGGVLLMSVASVAPRFVDEECWRFTPRGISSALAGFSKVEIVAETSSLGGLVRTITFAVCTFAHFPFLRKLVELTICPFLNLFGLVVEGLRLTENDQLTPNYSVLAIK